MKGSKKRKGSPAFNPGFALVFTLFALVIIAVVGLGFVSVLITGSRGSYGYFNNTRSLHYAKAGIARAIAELEANTGWRTRNENMGNGSYAATATPDPNNATRSLQQWSVSSTGTSGGSSRTLTVLLQQNSFAAYAYFTDKEQSVSGATIWFFSRDQLTGPVHTNGYFSFAGHPKFGDKVTSSQGVVSVPADPYYNQGSNRYTQGPGSPPYSNPFYFYHDFASYIGHPADYVNNVPVALNNSPTFSFAGGQPSLTMPSNLNSIQNQATQTFTGDCTFVLNSNGTATASETLDGSGCTQPPGGPNFSTANSTFWVTGNVSVSGTMSGHLTLGSGASSGINDLPAGVVITGNVLYNNSATDTLGLAAVNNITVNTDPNIYQDLRIDASLMALSSFGVQNYNAGVPRGTLHIYGGIIQTNRGAVGTFSNGRLRTGYTKDYRYDPVLAITPPPNFPTTGQVVVKEWIDSSALGH